MIPVLLNTAGNPYFSPYLAPYQIMTNLDNQSGPNHVTYTKHQQLFVQVFTAILIDLVILNLFNEYWDQVVIDSFTISLLAAVLLQVLLRTTIKIEHRISGYFDQKSGGFNKVLKYLSLWAVLFGSKFIILGAIERIFGDRVLFLGAYHGIITFIIVIVVMLLAENLIVKINQWVGLIGKEDA